MYCSSSLCFLGHCLCTPYHARWQSQRQPSLLSPGDDTPPRALNSSGLHRISDYRYQEKSMTAVLNAEMFERFALRDRHPLPLLPLFVETYLPF